MIPLLFIELPLLNSPLSNCSHQFLNLVCMTDLYDVFSMLIVQFYLESFLFDHSQLHLACFLIIFILLDFFDQPNEWIYCFTPCVLVIGKVCVLSVVEDTYSTQLQHSEVDWLIPCKLSYRAIQNNSSWSFTSGPRGPWSLHYVITSSGVALTNKNTMHMSMLT